MKTCENCGERVYNLGCVNCDEENYIEEQEYITSLKPVYEKPLFSFEKAVPDEDEAEDDEFADVLGPFDNG